MKSITRKQLKISILLILIGNVLAFLELYGVFGLPYFSFMWVLSHALADFMSYLVIVVADISAVVLISYIIFVLARVRILAFFKRLLVGRSTFKVNMFVWVLSVGLIFTVNLVKPYLTFVLTLVMILICFTVFTFTFISGVGKPVRVGFDSGFELQSVRSCESDLGLPDFTVLDKQLLDFAESVELVSNIDFSSFVYNREYLE